MLNLRHCNLQNPRYENGKMTTTKMRCLVVAALLAVVQAQILPPAVTGADFNDTECGACLMTMSNLDTVLDTKESADQVKTFAMEICAHLPKDHEANVRKRSIPSPHFWCMLCICVTRCWNSLRVQSCTGLLGLGLDLASHASRDHLSPLLLAPLVRFVFAVHRQRYHRGHPHL
jgi:hypothetical protein